MGRNRGNRISGIRERVKEMEIKVTKKDMVSLIYRMKNRFKKDLLFENHPRFDAQVSAIIDTIDPTGEYKKEAETESFLSGLAADIWDAKTDISNLKSDLETAHWYKKFAMFTFSLATAAVVMALIAVIK